MLARDPLTPAMRQDLVYVLHTIEELAAQLLETGHYAEASAKQNIDSRGQGLDVHTKQFLLQLTKPDQTTKFKHVALLVIFIVRIQMVVHAHAPRGRRGSIADKARLKRSVTPSAANSASEAAFANMQRIVNFDLPVRRALECVDSWQNFDIFRLCNITQGRPLKFTGLLILEGRDLIARLGMSGTLIATFLGELERTYLDNPYHNSTHAADVTQTIHLLIGQIAFSELELFATIMAAMCHDAGHPGVTNDFRIATGDHCAITYNDLHVNENMHCALTYRLIQRRDCNFVAALSTHQQKLFRRTMIDVVIATDMSSHFATMQRFQAAVDTSSPDVCKWDNRELALEVLLHAADLSNACKPWPLAKAWADCILEEFFAQGDRERTLGRPISPLCDRHTVSRPASQVGFIDFIVRPVFEAIRPVCQLREPLANVAVTFSNWTKEAELEKQEKENDNTKDGDG